jgi:GT2 family glycosyltransferase
MMSGAASPFVSIVVPTWNRAALLADCLGALRQQDFVSENFEIVVVDDGSTDATEETVHRFQALPPPDVRYVRQPHGGANRARNAGVRASKGDPVIFVEDDVDVPREWLAALVEATHRHPEAGCVGGPIRVRFEAPAPRICAKESWVNEGELDQGPDERVVAVVFGGNLAARRWAFERIGLFTEALNGLYEEVEWQVRLTAAGIPIVYAPAAWLWHRRTAADVRRLRMLRRRFRQGMGRVAYARFAGERLPLWRITWPIPFFLVHALRRRCFGALLEVAFKLGVVRGAMTPRRSTSAGQPGG